MSTTAQTHQQDLERLKALRYIDDDFMTVCLVNNYEGNDEIGRLMHDFSCTNLDDMNYEALAKKARYYKQDEKGVATMCKIMEDMRNEAAKKTTKDSARRLLKLGKIKVDEISECFPDLSDSDIKELEAKSMKLV